MNVRPDKIPLAEHQWRAKLGNKKTGPLSEAAVRTILYSESLKEGTLFQKGDSPFWPAEEVRKLLDQLDSEELYVCKDETLYGPFTPVRFMALFEAGKLDGDEYRVRKGTRGEWKSKATFMDEMRGTQHPTGMNDQVRPAPYEATNSSASTHHVENPSIPDVGKSSLESIELGEDRDEMNVPAEVEAFERALIQSADGFLEHFDEEDGLRQTAQSSEPILPKTAISATPSSGEDLSIASSQLMESRDTGDLADHTKRKKVRTGAKRGRVCLDCGGYLNLKTGQCQRCHEQELAEQESAEKPTQAKSKPIESGYMILGIEAHQLTKVMALCFTLATSGAFLTLGSVSAVVWRSMHSSNQQTLGWLAMGVGFALAWIAKVVIQKEFEPERHPMLKNIGVSTFLITALITYFLSTERLRAMDDELREQMKMWTELMESGGYQRDFSSMEQPEANASELQSVRSE